MRITRGALAVTFATAAIGVAACNSGKSIPDSEQCHFQGDDVACVQHWGDKPDTTTLDSPAHNLVAGDPGPDYTELEQRWSTLDHPSTWPPAPEPGREQYLTPYEDSLSNDDRPFAPERHCRDHSEWWDLSQRCPDGSAGTIEWIHHDGTVVVIGPDSPRGQRWNGGQIW